MKEFFLEDTNELQPYFLKEDTLNENYNITTEQEFIKCSNRIITETTKMLKKIETAYKNTADKRKFITKLYRLNRKIKQREEFMNQSIRRGEYASAIRFCVYTGDIRYIGTILEINSWEQILKNIIGLAIDGSLLSGALAIRELVVSRRLATTKSGINQIKKYMSFLRSTSSYLEKTLYKFAPDNYTDFKNNT